MKASLSAEISIQSSSSSFEAMPLPSRSILFLISSHDVLSGLSKPKMPVAKFELPVAKYFYRLPPGGVLMVQILSTRGHLVHSLHTSGS